MRAASGLLVGTLAIVLAACSGGGQSNSGGAGGTGSGTGGGAGSGTGGSAGGGSGGGSYTLSSLTDKCDTSGPSGNDVLALTQPSYQLTLDYVAAQDAGADAGASTSLTLKLAYSGGTITCHPHVSAPPGSGVAGKAASVDVTLHVTFSTSDGKFNESFDAPLSAAAGATYATLDHSIAIADFKGSYQPTLSGVSNARISVAAQFAAANSWGSVMQGGQKSGGGAYEVVPVGNWDNR